MSALCLLLSVGSAAACLLLGVQAAALQGRVAALEEERELLRRAGPPGALDAWAEPHLERLLREVSVGSRGRGGPGSVGLRVAERWGPGQRAGLWEEGCPPAACARGHPRDGRVCAKAEAGDAGPRGFCGLRSGLRVPCQAGGRGKREGGTRDFGITDLGSVSTGCALGHAASRRGIKMRLVGSVW